jgi:glycosyltransferase involved in cell wall biosynthesis
MNPSVSIALATYNGEKYLSDFLDSVYNQTYQNIEVIAVDDCSSDKTVEILEKFNKNYGLKYSINEKNLGFIKNFEKTLNLCKGEYIALADQDDIWFPDRIETLLNNIGNHLLIHSDAVLIDAENKKIANSFSEFSNKRFRLTSFKNMLFYNSVTGCTAMFHRKLLDVALPFPEKILYHDWWLGLIAARNNSVKYFPGPLLQYRQHHNISGGAEIMSFKLLVSNSFLKGFFVDRMDKNLKFLNWFNAIISFKKLEIGKEKGIVTDMIEYHQSFFIKKIRIRAFFIHLKYFNYLFPHYRFHTRSLILFTSLIGLGKGFQST